MLLTRFFALLALWIGATAPALAHGPTPQKAEEKITIAAPPEKVWDALKSFADVSWNPATTKTEATSGNESSTTRTITLNTGNLI